MKPKFFKCLTKASCTITAALLLDYVTLHFLPHYRSIYHPSFHSLNKAAHSCFTAFAILCPSGCSFLKFPCGCCCVLIQVSASDIISLEVFPSQPKGTSLNPPPNSILSTTKSIALLSTFWNDIAYLPTHIICVCHGNRNTVYPVHFGLPTAWSSELVANSYVCHLPSTVLNTLQILTY